LLKSQEDEEDARITEKADGLFGIPVVGYTAEGHGHNAGGKSSHNKNTSDVVHLTSAVHQRDSRAGVFVGEYEQIDGGAGGANTDINIEGLGPASWAIRETTPSNGSKNRSETPG
jgi:hypothetical protein